MEKEKEEEKRGRKKRKYFFECLPFRFSFRMFPGFLKTNLLSESKDFLWKKLWDGQPVKLNETTIFFYKNWSSAAALISSIEVAIIYVGNSGIWILIDVVSPKHYQSWPNQITFRNLRIWCSWINKRKISFRWLSNFHFQWNKVLLKLGLSFSNM